MSPTPIEEALAHAEKQLEHDRKRIVHTVGLRIAETKFMVNKIRSWAKSHNENTLLEKTGILIPPMNEDAILEYALNAHPQFTEEIFPLLEREMKKSEDTETLGAWTSELDETLASARRTVVQNLSKHPAMKPFQLLRYLNGKQEEAKEKKERAEQLEKERIVISEEVRDIQLEREEIWKDPRAHVLNRLLQSRETLLNQKKQLVDAWTKTWGGVQPVLETLSRTTYASDTMENAQLRILQLYLANPSRARTRDPHGAGLLMLLRWAVEALEKDEELSPREKGEMRDTLLDVLSNATFVSFFEYMMELDSALETNQREYVNHPLYHSLVQLDALERETKQKMERVLIKIGACTFELETVNKESRRVWVEANEICQRNLGFSLQPLNE